MSVVTEARVEAPRLTVLAWGNPGRGDDALGPEFAQRLQAAHQGPARLEVVVDFQLQIEHALDLVDQDLALFVDASLSCPPPFVFEELSAAREIAYTTHAMPPTTILRVYHDIQGEPPPPAFLLSLRGESFEFGASLGVRAEQHLAAALEWSLALCACPWADAWRERTGRIEKKRACN